MTAVAVLNGVAWSQALDEVFVKNYENDSTLTWQYFGSAEGYFRNYPGTVGMPVDVDVTSISANKKSRINEIVDQQK